VISAAFVEVCNVATDTGFWDISDTAIQPTIPIINKLKTTFEKRFMLFLPNKTGIARTGGMETAGYGAASPLIHTPAPT
jgi:hypothetical protein